MSQSSTAGSCPAKLYEVPLTKGEKFGKISSALVAGLLRHCMQYLYPMSADSIIYCLERVGESADTAQCPGYPIIARR